MSGLAWVVGRGGLLGSHVEATLHARPGWTLFRPGRFSWGDRARLGAEMDDRVREFGDQAARHERWGIFWCAGSGVVGALASSLAAESASLEDFLLLLREKVPGAGSFFLASSAGGVWGGSADRPITEVSQPRPISSYGLVQLEKEDILARWALRSPRVSTLVGRLSNLYGPGQALAKPQGLVSQLSRSLLHGRPAHVFVPLDTIRDYLYVEDAAQAIVRSLERLGEEAARLGAARHVLKIIASEQATTVGELLGALRRTAKRPLKVVTGLHPFASEQPACLRFRSTVWRDAWPGVRTGLVEGIGRVYRHELALYQAGLLPPQS